MSSIGSVSAAASWSCSRSRASGKESAAILPDMEEDQVHIQRRAVLPKEQLVRSCGSGRRRQVAQRERGGGGGNWESGM